MVAPKINLDKDMSAALQQKVQDAITQNTPLNICGSGSKHFLGRSTQGECLSLVEHRGIIEYDPRELVLTARAGTPLAGIEAELANAGQMLTFEPPHFGAAATLGGTIACGLSGPRRPYAGAARDAVLGCKIINGQGEILSFGGQVMKNVAGYDVSRLMVGAYGTLGVLLEISLKVLPRPAASLTLMHEHSTDESIRYMSHLLTQPMPVDAACHQDGHTFIRIAGSEQAVKHAQKQMGGEPVNDASAFWQSVREQQHTFFSSLKPLYRVMVKPATPALNISGNWLLDWGGAQRWLLSDEPLSVIRERVNAAGGHVNLYRNHAQSGEFFSPLPGPLFDIHQRLKLSFDPHRIFNPDRTYSGL
ncbi:MAG TPA: glycolate oxidase subunit GlcE [Gallionellaceae bacterium]|jgi:glycolate oxidase FAD binding subunit|nr:glycolate oxidase subunit GlcE [Gallionellaceae bacterium]HQS74330.1 glycolate oxidase subunit GlcE [Gallionellaceae bacterium]